MSNVNIPKIIITPPSPVVTKKKNRNRRKKQQQSVNIYPVVKTHGTSSAPVAQQRTVRQGQPKVKGDKGGVTVTHREYVADVVRSTANFFVDSYSVNPGIANSFPWLTKVAGNYESYTFERLDYVFEPMVSTSQAGSIMMAIDFDAADSQPATKSTLMSYAGAVRSAPWQACRVQASNIERKKMVHERYVRTGTVPTGTDVKTYDVGNLHIATVGTGTTAITLGELYVEYTVRLRTPQIATAPGLAVNRRASQAGTITVVNDVITQHVANVVGEGFSPLLLCNIGSKNIHFSPELRNWFFSYLASLQSGTWAQAFSTICGRGNYNGTYPFASLTQAANSLLRYSRPASGFLPAGSTQGGTQKIHDVLQFFVPEKNNLPAFGPFGSGAILTLRSPVSSGTYNLDYSIFPIEAEIPDSTAFTLVDQVAGSITQKDLDWQWPTNWEASPAREFEGNQITFGRPPYREEIVDPKRK